MTLEALKFLRSKKGRELLDNYKNVNIKDLPSLVFKLSKKDISFTSEMVTLLKLRINALEKFFKASEMYFTTDGLEQASSEKVSEYVASRFKKVIKNGVVTDLTSGIGGNAVFLAKYFKVRAVDLDKVHLECVKYNSFLYKTFDNIEFIHGKAEDNIKDSQAFIIDPQRIRGAKTKTRSIYNSEPNIVEMLPKMLEVTENICIKISPAFDYEEVFKLPGDPEIEIISENNNNKGAFLWFGEFKNAKRKATILDDKDSVFFSDNIDLQNLNSTDSLKKYLFIPNKAIIKANLAEQVASFYNLLKISDKNELMTSDEIKKYPHKVFRCFEVLDYDIFSMKNIKNLVKINNIDRAHIVARHFGVNPEELRKRMKLKEGGEYSLILTDLADKKYIILTKNRKC
jgi:hypothetical protein